ncbi:hypothetical protein V8C34DRAFT_272956 [Trichoderma compactum]
MTDGRPGQRWPSLSLRAADWLQDLPRRGQVVPFCTAAAPALECGSTPLHPSNGRRGFRKKKTRGKACLWLMLPAALLLLASCSGIYWGFLPSRESWKNPLHRTPCLTLNFPSLALFRSVSAKGPSRPGRFFPKGVSRVRFLCFSSTVAAESAAPVSQSTCMRYSVLVSSKHRPWSGSNLQAAPRRCGTDIVWQWWHAACGCRYY